jgi:hypothetical protein
MPNKAKRFLSELPGGDEGFLYKNIASLAACEGARFLLLDREMFTVPRTCCRENQWVATVSPFNEQIGITQPAGKQDLIVLQMR